jgi:hypothetical protein
MFKVNNNTLFVARTCSEACMALIMQLYLCCDHQSLLATQCQASQCWPPTLSSWQLLAKQVQLTKGQHTGGMPCCVPQGVLTSSTSWFVW